MSNCQNNAAPYSTTWLDLLSVMSRDDMAGHGTITFRQDASIAYPYGQQPQYGKPHSLLTLLILQRRPCHTSPADGKRGNIKFATARALTVQCTHTDNALPF